MSVTYSQVCSHATIPSMDPTGTRLSPSKYSANGRCEPGPNALAGTRIVTRSHADSRLTRRAAKRMNGVRSPRSNPPDVVTGIYVLTFINTVAFGRRCIPHRGVARRLNTPGILSPRRPRFVTVFMKGSTKDSDANPGAIVQEPMATALRSRAGQPAVPQG